MGLQTTASGPPAGFRRGHAKWLHRPLVVVGAALVAWSAAIHLYLWEDYFHRIHIIGPLFFGQGVAGTILAIALVLSRNAVPALVGALFLCATAGGLLVSMWVGLFGYHERLGAPHVVESLLVEIVGAAVLIGAAALRPRTKSSRSPGSAGGP